MGDSCWRFVKSADRLPDMKKMVVAMALMAVWAQGEVKLEVNGLRVVGKGYSAESDEDAMNAEIRAFNWSPGTSVSLLFTAGELSIVALNEKESKITSLTDDKGTDFSKAKSRFSNEPYKFGWSNVSKDGKALGTTIEANGVPAKGAKSLIIKGEVVVTTGSKTEKVQSGTVALKEGTTFEVGGFTFKIKRVEEPKFGDSKVSVTLETSKNMDALKEVIFLDESGEKIESEQRGSGSFGFGGKMTYSRSFGLKKKVSEVEIGLLKWTDLKQVKVPLDLTLGVGL